MHHGSGDSGRTAGRALTGSFCHYQTFTVTDWNDRLWSIPALRLSTSTQLRTFTQPFPLPNFSHSYIFEIGFADPGRRRR